MKLVVGVCDDDAIQVDTISYFLKKNICRYELELLKAHSGEELLLKLQNKSPDVVFLDIEMEHMNGLQLGKKIREKHKDTIIVFITGYMHFALQAFELKTMDYIIKPITEKRLHTLLEDIQLRIEQLRAYEENNKTMTFKFRDTTLRLKFSEIYYFEKSLRKITVYSTLGEFAFYDTMENLLCKLDEKIFVRCHSSYIINRQKIFEIRNDSIYIKELDKAVPVSRKNKALVRDLLEKNLFV